MIRMVLLGVTFVAVTITLILIQPSTQRPNAQIETDPGLVTRADTDFSAPGEAAIDADLAAAASVTTDPVINATDVDLTPPGNTALETMVITALRQGQSDDYIDALVNHAARNGTVEVPGSLVTPDGRVDTTTLLTVLSKAPDAMRSGAQLYVVRPGDSLASISFRFYGTTNKAPEIFAANEALMESPRNIAVGQELVIPAQ